jgi:hypothetical protein
MLKKTKFWVLLFAALFLLGCGAFLLLKNSGGSGHTAEIWQDGTLIRTIDLDAVAAPYDFEVTGEWGVNTVHVEHGAISVTAADCPDQICVEQGAISTGAVPIVCMPHKLVIDIVDGDA